MIETSKNIILAELARVGDRVFGNPDINDSSKDRSISGKLGTVFAISTFKDYVPRFGNLGRTPGIYLRQGTTIVRWDDGTGGNVSPFDIGWWPWEGNAPAGISKKNLHAQVAEHNEQMNDKRQAARSGSLYFEDASIKLGSLPAIGDKDPYEMDIITLHSGEIMRVRSINWQYYGERRDDASFMPMLNAEPLDSSYTTSVGLDEVLKIERGPVWKWYNGLADKVTFDDIKEEARFYRGLGRAKSIRNSEGIYSFTLEEALEVIRKGGAHGISVQGGLFGTGPRTEVLRFEDEEPAARIRAATLEGFGVSESEPVRQVFR